MDGEEAQNSLFAMVIGRLLASLSGSNIINLIATKTMGFLLSTIENSRERAKAIEDPVIRHTLTLEKLCTLTDIANVYMTSLGSELGDQELATKITNMVKNTNADIRDLMLWIQSPQYSPNHPFGRSVMDGAKEEFDTASK